ncbi:MAG TPA: cobalamin biosynthesis protein P47K, partial [Peptococcaceae bacterium]|nr:cobalamin biosynthesis protein P47K [Peptococcaceae bacterium]
MNIILTGGFLGSGKTTFIRQLARFMVKQKGKNVVIIENEAGEVSIDDKLLSLDG